MMEMEYSVYKKENLIEAYKTKIKDMTVDVQSLNCRKQCAWSKNLRDEIWSFSFEIISSLTTTLLAAVGSKKIFEVKQFESNLTSHIFGICFNLFQWWIIWLLHLCFLMLEKKGSNFTNSSFFCWASKTINVCRFWDKLAHFHCFVHRPTSLYLSLSVYLSNFYAAITLLQKKAVKLSCVLGSVSYFYGVCSAEHSGHSSTGVSPRLSLFYFFNLSYFNRAKLLPNIVLVCRTSTWIHADCPVIYPVPPPPPTASSGCPVFGSGILYPAWSV